MRLFFMLLVCAALIYVLVIYVSPWLIKMGIETPFNELGPTSTWGF